MTEIVAAFVSFVVGVCVVVALVRVLYVRPCHSFLIMMMLH